MYIEVGVVGAWVGRAGVYVCGNGVYSSVFVMGGDGGAYLVCVRGVEGEAWLTKFLSAAFSSCFISVI